MKLVLWACVIAAATLWQPAGAQPGGFGPWSQAREQGAQPRGSPRPPRGDPGQRRAGPERDERRQGRLTDEERRELRRDIDQANRDIYRRKFRR